MAADWSATFLLDDVHGSFHLVAASDADASTGTLGCLDFPLASWPSLARLQRESIVTLTGEDAGRMPGPLTGGQSFATVLLAAIRRDGVMAGVLAVGYRTTPSDGLEVAVRLLAGIVEQAAIVLRNARLLEEVRAASQLKSEFVGTISHELRSPMNVILGYTEMLLEGGLGPIASEQRDVLARTHGQALTLLEMITALLDVNRLEAGRLPVEKGPVVVQELLAEIIGELPDRWRSPQIEVRLEAAQGLPPLETDRAKLKTAVRNLVHNALKFTEHGYVTLAAGQTSTGDLTIRVTDTGRGIPAEAIPYIFDMFRQVPGSGGGGVGLGLHIVHRFVDVLGGTVDVTSEVDVGTCFTVTLPGVARPAQAA
jgi:signal transduction histidine kinase